MQAKQAEFLWSSSDAARDLNIEKLKPKSCGTSEVVFPSSLAAVTDREWRADGGGAPPLERS